MSSLESCTAGWSIGRKLTGALEADVPSSQLIRVAVEYFVASWLAYVFLDVLFPFCRMRQHAVDSLRDVEMTGTPYFRFVLWKRILRPQIWKAGEGKHASGQTG